MSDEENNSNEEEAPKEEAPKAAAGEGDHGYPGNHGYKLNNMVVNSHLAGKATTSAPAAEDEKAPAAEDEKKD
jgi:hypothetical protein